ncbi:MAG: alpha/beta fold hydrolase [Sphingomonas sp.]|uniref:alpha/beta fold hydrolase n=1 Tax=Sphingomonas sp. TaxID=28214 RepID=UPI001ACC5C18|nr:alpha/beta fold hydrolase [Sphingomonas sp.]MBN8849850.1 alpha/beta fold hydrolase [Sphingomonas sp.]
MQATAPSDPISAARAEFERMMARNISGLSYFTSPAPVVGATPKDVLIARGPMRLNHYRAMTDEVYRVPILLVMATTNRGFIFDLVPGQSLVEFLLKAGFDVFMLEWEAPRSHERTLTLEDYAVTFIGAAVERIKEETGEPDVSIIGYCFGGVLSLLHTALHRDTGIANLVTFTTPIDFSQMGMFAAWSDQRYFDVDRLVETFGNVPGDMLYSSFDMLRPAARAVGNIRLYDNLWDEEYVKSFRMFERWNTDTLPLAGEYFRQTTKMLMWENRLLNGTMEVGGRKVDPGSITIPFLHLAAEHDHIVPRAASAPLIEMIGSDDKQEIMLKGGHVSLVAGGNAIKRMWPTLAGWLAERSL